jgi:large subunit ribosomal protein L13
MTKTTFATMTDRRRAMQEWFTVDASQHVLGRMAARIAEVLMGKHTPLYTPHIGVGTGIIVVNAKGVRITGEKRTRRVDRSYTGFPGGLKESRLGDRLEANPCEVIRDAVRRMLPKTRAGREMLRRLKVYAGNEHRQIAQRPSRLPLRS